MVRIPFNENDCEKDWEQRFGNMKRRVEKEKEIQP